MTKTEAIERIKNLIELYGFQAETNERFSPLPFLKGDLYIAVIIQEQPDFENCNFEKKVTAYTVGVQASVRKMGGNPTPEELLEAADQIRRGAELAQSLQSLNLSYTVEL